MLWTWLEGLSGGAATFVGSLTGSVFGFLALILGALFNFRLNRRRDNHIREDEARSVAAALYGEILLLQNELASVANNVAAAYVAQGTRGRTAQKFDVHFMERCKQSEPTLYKALASKIGLLRSEHVIAITEFHAHFEQVRTWLPRLMDDPNRSYSYSVLHVLHPARDAIQNVKPTLRAIERQLMMATPAKDPDIGEAKSAIDFEEATWEP